MKNKTLTSILVTLIIAGVYWIIKGIHSDNIYEFIVTLLGYSVAYSIYVIIIPSMTSIITMMVKRDKKWPHEVFSKLTYLCLALFTAFLFWGLTASQQDLIENSLVDVPQQTKFYENNEHGFKVKFPSNWKIKKGEGKYGIVSADLETEGQVNIQIKELLTDKKSIYDLYTKDEFVKAYVESLKGSYLGIQLVKVDRIKIGSADAYKSEQNVKSMDSNGNEMTFLMSTNVFCTKNKIYIITIAIATDERRISKSVIDSILNSFSLKNGN